MPLAVVQRGYLEGSDAVIDAFKDCLVAGGWTLYDDLSSGSDKAYVMKSLGESGTEFPIYLHIHKSTTQIRMYTSRGWNLTTHAVRQLYGNTSYSYLVTPGASSFMYFYVSCNKDSAFFTIYSGSLWDIFGVTLIDYPFTTLGILQSDVTSGADKVIQLAAGEADDFEVGGSYDITDEISRNYITVTAVDTVNHRITATLTYNFTVANYARVGNFPDCWMSVSYKGTPYFLTGPKGVNGTTNANNYEAFDSVFAHTLGDPCGLLGKYILVPLHPSAKGGTAIGGFSKATCVMMRVYINATSEHTLSVGDLDSGQSSGSNSGTTLNDTTQAWTVNEFADKVIIITGGTGVNQIRKIVSNTATEITVAAWDTTPDATSTYVICEEAWIYFYRDAATKTCAFRMM